METYERFDKPSCVGCSQSLKKSRGCNKNGFKHGEAIYRFTSPRLNDLGEEASILYECPVGKILKDAPATYEIISMQQYVESGRFGPYELSRVTNRALSIIYSEKARLREIKDKFNRGKRDSEYGVNLIKRNR